MKFPGSFNFLIFIVFSSHILIGQELSSSQIDSIVNKSMETMPQAGIAVAVIKNGEIVHAKGYGVTSIETNEKVNENTRFAIASNTKSFTATALAILVDEGKLDWRDKVVDHIPEFKMYNPYITANFNIQDLLTHRSGLGLGAGDLMFFPDGADFTISDVLKSFQYQKPVSAFRTKFDYDNLLYMVAGEVVARVSGISWSEFVEQRIMKPLGMTNSAGLYKNLKSKSNVALPHSSEKGKIKQLATYEDPNGTLGAAGGIYSSVIDLGKWLQMHLDGGKYGKNLETQLISRENHAEMLKPHTNMEFTLEPKDNYKTHFNAYGLGWDISDMNGFVVVQHTGGLPGMLSRTLMVPELDLGIIVLTNSSPGGFSFFTIPAEILDSYLDIERRDWISFAKERIDAMESAGDSVLTAVWETVEKAKSKDLNIEDYLGIYQDNWFGKVEIMQKDGKLWFRSFRSPKLHGEMFFYKANTFAVKWDYQDMECDAFASFELNENGKATRIKMKGISPNIDFSFDFQDLDLKRID